MIRIAAVQLQGHRDKEVNIEKASRLIREAAKQGAKIICLPELFTSIYFCYEWRQENFQLAEPIPGPTTEKMADLAREIQSVLICPIFEKSMTGEYYNSAAVLGPQGELLGKYQKSHIPLVVSKTENEERVWNEKYYFRPGKMGFPAFPTPFGVTIGILICYDRHFPEAARAVALNGADILFVPTAASAGFTRNIWEIELRAHAASNILYVCGLNRVGRDFGGSDRSWFGSSVIINPRGEILAQASDTKEEIIMADVDPGLIAEVRNFWNYYRDRRPEIYGDLAK